MSDLTRSAQPAGNLNRSDRTIAPDTASEANRTDSALVDTISRTPFDASIPTVWPLYQSSATAGDGEKLTLRDSYQYLFTADGQNLIISHENFSLVCKLGKGNDSAGDRMERATLRKIPRLSVCF